MVITQLRQRIRSLENDKMMLEKKLKFKDILGDMRGSSQMQDEELLHLKKRVLDLQRENGELRRRRGFHGETVKLEEQLKTVHKELRNEKKMHEADLTVLSNLQTVLNGLTEGLPRNRDRESVSKEGDREGARAVLRRERNAPSRRAHLQTQGANGL